MIVPYIQHYASYTMTVVPLNNGNFNVEFIQRSGNAIDHGIVIEECRTEDHAVRGAKQFPVFYEIAKQHGFRMAPDCFKHADGREVDYSYAMDLDRTPESFTMLLKGQ